VLTEASVTADRSHLRASHADREQVIDTLKAAFVQGRLAKDEFDTRIGQTFASRTHADLAAVTSDIPAGRTASTAARPPCQAARALTRTERAAAWGSYSVVLTVIFTIAVIPGQTTIGTVLLTTAVIYSVFWLLGGLMVVASRHRWPRPCAGPPAVSQARGGASRLPRG
jgi:Domain of unknown function (DUF1707)